MAYLNQQERDALSQELKSLDFIHAKRRLFLIDKDGRLAFFRNAQHSGQLETRFELQGLGTRVTIIEKHTREKDPRGDFYNANYEILEIKVEALPGNRL
jgi:hypothetical protein